MYNYMLKCTRYMQIYARLNQLIMGSILMRRSYLKWENMPFLKTHLGIRVILSISNRTHKIYVNLLHFYQSGKPPHIKQCVIRGEFGGWHNLRGYNMILSAEVLYNYIYRCMRYAQIIAKSSHVITTWIFVRGSYLEWESMSYLIFYHIWGVILSISNRTHKIHVDLPDLCQGEKASQMELYFIRGALGGVENLRG
jgi:hypothetical protein